MLWAAPASGLAFLPALAQNGLVYRHTRLRLAFCPPPWPVSATATALTTALCQRATTNRCAAAQTEK